MQFWAACYRTLAGRRGWLVILLLGLVLFAALALTRLQVGESIEAMLPDGTSQVARDFQLLQRAPFARKLVIHLRADDKNAGASLLVATERLRKALPEPFFENPISGPGELKNSPLLRELGGYLPRVADSQDLEVIAERLSPEQIDAQLAAVYSRLLQPQGVALKAQLRQDPLSLDRLALQKLRFLNPIGKVRLVNGQFISQDRHSSLILADTQIPITDANGSRQLLDAFDVAKRQLPAGVIAELVSGHRYTLANAETIKADMQRLLLVSGIGILLLFLLFLRSLRALFVYLLPLLSMLVAVLVTAGWFGTVSGITLGFGAVLLGITIDFGLHVYFALRHGSGLVEREQLLQAVSRPVLFGGFTTLAAFVVLLRSELPGQRQLAVFAIAGIAAALLLALVFLPHFLGERKGASFLSRQQLGRHVFDRAPKLRKFVLLVWLLLVGFSAWQAQKIHINGELRQLGYQPKELLQAEHQLAEQWGNMRGRALVFAEGADLQAALRRNDMIWSELHKLGAEDEVVSLAPLFPSVLKQRQRLLSWEEFWQNHRGNSFDLVQAGGAKYGFSANAFEPFWNRLDQRPPPINRQLLEHWRLKPLLDNLLQEDEQGVQLLTLLPDRPELLSKLEQNLSRLPGITVVSQSRFGRQLSQEIGADFSRFISYAGIAVLLLLLLLFRRLPDILLALLPVLTGLIVMFGGMGLLGLEMNLFNVVASILIIGLGVDYGIFMVCHGQQEENLASARAILISGLTTLVGFGALVLAKHPALHSIGLTVLLGIGAAVPTAILVIPAFRPKRR